VDADRARSLLEAARASAEQLLVDEGDVLSPEVRAIVRAEVEAALARLAAGRFGICETCGRPIADDRIEALPTARFCVADERAWEADALALRAEDDRRDPGWKELDQSPDEDDGEPPVRCNEEVAVHDEETGAWPDEDDLLVADPELLGDEDDAALQELEAEEDALG
jgi:hypothetical protein